MLTQLIIDSLQHGMFNEPDFRSQDMTHIEAFLFPVNFATDCLYDRGTRMKKSRWIMVFALAALTLVVVFIILRSGRQSALEKYKAELRAKGEKLSFSELGFPKQPENPAGLQQLTNAAGRIQKNTGFIPGEITFMKFTAPGRAQVIWRSQEVEMIGFRTTNTLNWEKFQSHFNNASNDLAEIRVAVEQPIRWFMYDPEQMGFTVRYPFVPMRVAAQWLSGDAINVLHANDRSRALADIHAITRLTEFNKEDPTLIAQMIRVAITGLGLSVTWQALQNQDWTESELVALQQDWDHADILQTFDLGLLGERASGERVFEITRTDGAYKTLNQIYSGFGSSSPWTGTSISDKVKTRFLAGMWRLSAEQDEMLALDHYQGMIDCARDLKQKPWPEVQMRSTNLINQLDKEIGGATGLGKYKYLLSSMMIPNHGKALLTMVRNETLRRLTITAIALKRFQLRHGKLPAGLEELVPEFISAVPIDLMNQQPLCYRLNPDGTFVLYSVGEDGKDDGGDPTSVGTVPKPDLWTGRDAVWPSAAQEGN